MRALVTGGAGLIGSHLADLLLEKGFEVRILDNLEPVTHPKGKPSWVPKEIDFIHGDVKNLNTLERSLKDVDIVFHQAAWGGFEPQISKFIESNVLATGRIFEVIRDKKYPVKKIIVASSQAVYGEGKYRCAEHGIQFPDPRPITQFKTNKWEVKCLHCGCDMKPMPTDEEKPKYPQGLYSLSKHFEETLALTLGRQMGLPTVCLRYALTYGPRQSIFNPYTGICSIFSTRIVNDLPTVIYEDGLQTRDFTYVGDVANANYLVATKEEANFEVYNVGTGIATTVIEFVKILAKKYNKQTSPLVGGYFRPTDVRHLFTDAAKLKKLGFTARVNLTEGLNRYTDWISQQGEVKDYFSEAMVNLENSKIVIRAS